MRSVDKNREWDADLVHNLVSNLSRDIEKRKEDIIRAKLIERNLGHLFDNIYNARFKRLAVEHIPDLGLEEWYVDDGTDDGSLLVTFSTSKNTGFDLYDQNTYSAVVNVKYY